ncbi:MAG: acyl-CoA reductase [Oscillospiraceae bacterium]|nr:acyl-CoA reductase [Oscillospiraceae bacterium]
MDYFLGIDGGGTKTKFLLCDEDGIIAGECTLPTSHFRQCGINGVVEILKQGTDACCEQAGIGKDRLAAVFAGLAGYGDNTGGADEQLAAKIAHVFPGTRFILGNDSENALSGALAARPGICVIAGTGSIGIGKNRLGRTEYCGGWKYALFGDEGSGYWIAWKLLYEFMRQSDGRAERTGLYEALRRDLALRLDTDIVRLVVEEWKFDRTRIAGLTGLVSSYAAEGDEAARKILTEASGELSGIALALAERLGGGEDLSVSYAGGVFSAGEHILGPMRKTLEAHGLRLCVPKLPPDCGAVLLAMQTADALHERGIAAMICAMEEKSGGASV